MPPPPPPYAQDCFVPGPPATSSREIAAGRIQGVWPLIHARSSSIEDGTDIIFLHNRSPGRIVPAVNGARRWHFDILGRGRWQAGPGCSQLELQEGCCRGADEYGAVKEETEDRSQESEDAVLLSPDFCLLTPTTPCDNSDTSAAGAPE